MVIYRITPVYRPWLQERIAVLSEPTLRQIIAALMGLVAPDAVIAPER